MNSGLSVMAAKPIRAEPKFLPTILPLADNYGSTLIIFPSERYSAGSTLNFCPPTEASYIRPPFVWVKIATPPL
jgi:hypothetical protein